MTRKFMALYLVLAIILSLFTGFSAIAIAAEKQDMLKNGSFEDVAANGIPTGWALTGAKADESFFVSTESPSEGSKSIRFYGDVSAFVAATVNNIKPGAEYEFTGMLKKIETKGDGPAVKIVYQTPDGKGSYTTLVEPSSGFSGTRKGKWEKVTFKSTAPNDTARAIILVRLVGGGECYWDDCHFIGEPSDGASVAANTKPATTEKSTVTADAGPVAATSPSQIISATAAGNGLYNVLKNGDFETVASTGLPTGWGLSGGTAGENYVTSTADAQSGSNSARFFGTSSSIFISSVISDCIAGEQYTFTGYLKMVSGEGVPQIMLNCQKKSGDTHADVKALYQTFNTKVGAWEKISYAFTVPEETTRIILLVRLIGGGECYWDNLGIIGKTSENIAVATDFRTMLAAESAAAEPALDNSDRLYEESQPYQGQAANLLKNGDFEQSSGTNTAAGWTLQSRFSPYATIQQGASNDGSACIRLAVPGTAGAFHPFYSQVVNLVGGAEYQVSYRYKVVKGEKATPRIKMEYFTDRSLPGASSAGEKYVGGKNTIYDGEWHKAVEKIYPAANVAEASVLVRLMQNNVTEDTEVYIDDVTICMTAPPAALDFDTSWIFYYTDMTEGTLSSSVNMAYYPNLANARVDFSISDGEKLLWECNNLTSNGGKASAPFSLSLLKEKAHPYAARATLYNTDGTVLETSVQNIYMYERPTYLGRDGLFIKNGSEPLYPTYAYHVRATDYKKTAEAGINVVQMGSFDSGEAAVAALDAAQEAGIMGFIALYYGMKPAGDDTNIERTIRVVNAVKDHPALFGYGVMDEVFLGLTNPEKVMETSFRLLRYLDPKHPIMTMEAVANYYAKSAKYVDILCIDPYGAASGKNASRSTEKARAAVNYEKPVYSLLEAYYNTHGRFPTPDDGRNNNWQALIAGANAVGYYSISDSDMDDSTGKYGIPIWNARDGGKLWNALVEFGEKEKQIAYDHFVFNKTPEFNEYRGDDYWYSSWVDGSDIYMVILGMKDSGTQSVSIPLTSFTGDIQIGDFTASVVAGRAAAATSGSGALKTDIIGAEAILFKITPSQVTDFSKLGATAFEDLESHDWARQQIAYLDSLGIVNGRSEYEYAPADKITRGEFAYFLIRTLGLTSDSTANFDDVTDSAFYSKEIAVGKALGILQGIGDNKYNPDAEISRQDMMTIISRGMGLSGEGADLSAFSDTAQIAGYALESVKAMIASGLIKGNADGTINPIGNTTRAEAAVIMYRIYNR